MTDEAAGDVVEQRAQGERAATEDHEGWEALHADVLPRVALPLAAFALPPAVLPQRPYADVLGTVRVDEIALPGIGGQADVGPDHDIRGLGRGDDQRRPRLRRGT